MHSNVDVGLHHQLWLIAPEINSIGKGIERPPWWDYFDMDWWTGCQVIGKSLGWTPFAWVSKWNVTQNDLIWEGLMLFEQWERTWNGGVCDLLIWCSGCGYVGKKWYFGTVGSVSKYGNEQLKVHLKSRKGNKQVKVSLKSRKIHQVCHLCVSSSPLGYNPDLELSWRWILGFNWQVDLHTHHGRFS